MSHKGLNELFKYPLMDAIIDRRTRRVAQGMSIDAGPLSHVSANEPKPLSELEEAVLVVSTGLTGSSTMHDVPTRNQKGEESFSAPLMNIITQATPSIDNVHSVNFIMINDEGTWLIKKLRGQAALDELAKRPSRWKNWSEQDWLDAADSVKFKLFDTRLDFPREWPYYFIWNRSISNVPGTTILLPLVDISRQVINVFLSLLSEDDGSRPLFVDDWSPFKPKTFMDWLAKIGSKLGFLPEIPYHLIGGTKWANDKWLNNKDVAAVSYYGAFRTEYETFMLLQNLKLTSQAMGLGAWLHAAVDFPVLFERDEEAGKFGLGKNKGDPSAFGFTMQKRKKFGRLRRQPPLPTLLDNPIGIEGVLESLNPPFVKNMDEAVDIVLEEKFGPKGPYGDEDIIGKAYKDPKYGKEFLGMAGARPSAKAIEYTKVIANYVYDTYGSFPAAANAFHVPGVWLQFSHLEMEYYQKYFDESLYQRQMKSGDWWDEGASPSAG